MENIRARALRPGDRIDTEDVRPAGARNALDRTRLATVQHVTCIGDRVRVELDIGRDLVLDASQAVSVRAVR